MILKIKDNLKLFYNIKEIQFWMEILDQFIKKRNLDLRALNLGHIITDLKFKNQKTKFKFIKILKSRNYKI